MTAHKLLEWAADILLMSVRTEDTRLINRAFILASSRCPNPGSAAPAVQPTYKNCQHLSIYMCFVVQRIARLSTSLRVYQGNAFARCRRGSGVESGLDGGFDVLRARNRSSERMAIALMRRTATASN